MQKQRPMKLVTMCVLVEADNDVVAFGAIKEAIGYSGTVHAPLFLACVDAKPAFGQIIEQHGDDKMLSALMRNTEVPIPYGAEYKVVDRKHGGAACRSGGIQSVWFRISDPVSKAGQPKDLSIYLRRTASGVIVDMSGEDVGDVLSSSTAMFADAVSTATAEVQA